MDRIRILLYVPLLELGGTEVKVARLATGLDRRRFEPMVAWSDGWGPVGNQLRINRIPVIYLDPRDKQTWPQRITDLNPDIFHSFNYKQDNQDVIAAHRAAIPAIVTARVDSRHWDPDGRLQEWEEIRNGCTTRITAVSRASAEICSRVEGVSLDGITVIPNGVPTPPPDAGLRNVRDELGIADSAPLLGCVGNYREEKGHAFLLQAFRNILDRRPDAHLVCCGSDSQGLKNDLHRLAEHLGIGQQAHLMDLRSDTGEMYRALDLYCQPSRSEGFSNSLLEAMSHGLPALATAVAGNAEAVSHGQTGLLVPPDDPNLLADAAVSLLADRPLAQRMGAAASARVGEHFSVEAMVRAHERLYEEIWTAQLESRCIGNEAVVPDALTIPR